MMNSDKNKSNTNANAQRSSQITQNPFLMESTTLYSPKRSTIVSPYEISDNCFFNRNQIFCSHSFVQSSLANLSSDDFDNHLNQSILESRRTSFPQDKKVLSNQKIFDDGSPTKPFIQKEYSFQSRSLTSRKKHYIQSSSSSDEDHLQQLTRKSMAESSLQIHQSQYMKKFNSTPKKTTYVRFLVNGKIMEPQYRSSKSTSTNSWSTLPEI